MARSRSLAVVMVAITLALCSLSACAAGTASAGRPDSSSGGLPFSVSDASAPSGDAGLSHVGSADATALRTDAGYVTSDAGEDAAKDGSHDGSFHPVPDAREDAREDAGEDARADAVADAAADTGTAVCPPPSGVTFSDTRGGNGDVLPLTGYDYAPTVIVTGPSSYQAWWCGANPVGGDEIRYAEASALDGPWHSHTSGAANTFDVALTAGGNGTALFDTTDSCDPSVIRNTDGTYLMYYGGNGAPWTGAPNNTTQIGVASSASGFPGTWTKLNGEQPIITPFANEGSASYGAGQPSAVVVGESIYLLYTDTTGSGGVGMYLLRAKTSDPTFSSAETWNGTAFVPLSHSTRTAHPISTEVDGDWAFSDSANAFVFATDRAFTTVHVALLDSDTFATLGEASLAAESADGPGVVHTPSGHLPPSAECGALPFDVLRGDCYANAVDTSDCSDDPYGNGSANIHLWDLAHVGGNLDIHETCACAPLDAGTSP